MACYLIDLCEYLWWHMEHGALVINNGEDKRVEDNRLPFYGDVPLSPIRNGKYSSIQALPAKKIYKTFQLERKEPHTCKARWQKAYGQDGNFPNLQWRKWFLMPYRLSHEVQIQNFMLHIAYRIIPCKVYLAQIKITPSELCTNCNRRDDMLHFFFECPSVRPFWDSLSKWIQDNSEIPFFPTKLTEQEFC